jgi:TonB family protein
VAQLGGSSCGCIPQYLAVAIIETWSTRMKRSTVFFFFVLVVIVAMIARCNSRSRLAEERNGAATPASPLVPSAAPTASNSPTASPQSTKTPPVDIAKAASQIQPAVVSLSIFEPSGKLLRTGTGVFVSTSGKILTTRSLVDGGAHAIAKTSDNRIHNVSGVLWDVASDDLAVLQMETKDQVPFIAPNRSVAVEEGTRVAVVQSPLGREKSSIVEGTIAKKPRDRGDWFELSNAVSNEAMGAPVVNGRGEVVGLVTHGPGDPAVVVRSCAALDAVVMRIPESPKAKWLAEETPPSPAEGPLRKMPLAENTQGRKSKLIYSPAPAYPSVARSSGVKGTGKFRLTFDPTGQVKNIVILRSTQNGTLDQAAVEALRHWKAAPGEEWTLNVPITFQ